MGMTSKPVLCVFLDPEGDAYKRCGLPPRGSERPGEEGRGAAVHQRSHPGGRGVAQPHLGHEHGRPFSHHHGYTVL